MIHPSPQIVACPHCQSRNFAIDDNCSTCGKPLTVTIGPRPRIRHVNLQTGMILIALIAVCLAPIRVAPGWSLFLLVWLLPPTIRGILMMQERQADGRPMVAQEKFDAFIGSCLITSLISLAALVAFACTCVPIGLVAVRDPREVAGFIVAILGGLCAAGFVLVYLGKRLWPRKD